MQPQPQPTRALTLPLLIAVGRAHTHRVWRHRTSDRRISDCSR
jgi:hypothetical protein